MKEPKPLWIDTDCGVDDALALLLALRSPELRTVGISTVAGNVEVAQCSQNVAAVLKVHGAETQIPIFQGSSRPLRRKRFHAPEVHGDDGLGGMRKRYLLTSYSPRRDAVGALLRAAQTNRGKLILIALGPLTNIAKAWLRDSRTLMSGVRDLVIMGGNFLDAGNTGPMGEFNFYVDPEAADIVLTSGLPIMLLPLDATQQTILPASEVRKHARVKTLRNRFIRDITEGYFQYHVETEGFDGGYPHDPLAVAAVINPAILSLTRLKVRVERKGEYTRGMCATDFVARNKGDKGVCAVAQGVDHGALIKLLRKRLWDHGV